MNIESKKVRYIFLDNIKVLFTIIVIFWHVSVTYMEAGWWYYKEVNPIDPVSYIIFLLFTSFAGVFQASLLGLFFLLGVILLLKVMIERGFGVSGKND
jgi:hypothetical protein